MLSAQSGSAGFVGGKALVQILIVVRDGESGADHIICVFQAESTADENTVPLSKETDK